MSKLRKFKYTFEFSTDRKLTYAEKMQISSDGLHALHGIVRDVVGDSAAHNMDFGWGPDGDPWEPKKKKPMDKLEPEDRKIVLAYDKKGNPVKTGLPRRSAYNTCTPSQ